MNPELNLTDYLAPSVSLKLHTLELAPVGGSENAAFRPLHESQPPFLVRESHQVVTKGLDDDGHISGENALGVLGYEDRLLRLDAHDSSGLVEER